MPRVEPGERRPCFLSRGVAKLVAVGIGTTQNVGHCLCTLLTTRALPMTRLELSNTTERNCHFNAQMTGSTTGRRAVVPAGGCVVPVRCMTASAIDTVREAASHCRLGEMPSRRSRRKIVAMVTPMRALKKWPRIRGRGWENGASTAP